MKKISQYCSIYRRRINNNEYRAPFENLFDADVFKLSRELEEIDALLNDPDIIKPFQKKIGVKHGRPTVPVSSYLRFMYLKGRHQLGYESLVEELATNIKWRRFCQITLDQPILHSTTFIRLTQKYGPEIIDAVNRQLLEQLKDKKILKGKKLRMDTAVVKSNIHYPTDAGLLSDSIRKITNIVKEIKEQGHAVKITFRDRTRTVKKTILRLVKNLRDRTKSKQENFKEQTRELMKTTRHVVEQAKDVAQDIAGAAKKDFFDGIKALHDDLQEFIGIADRVQEQTKKVLIDNGQSIPSRIVSIFDTTARPIKKGKLGVRAEFGHKVLVQDTEQAIITGYQILLIQT